MNRSLFFLIISVLLITPHVKADQIGSAEGQGVIQRFIPGDPNGETEDMPFNPRFSFAYTEGTGGGKFTWIVLADKEPPINEFLTAGDLVEARKVWCKDHKASFVAVKLDSKLVVDLFFLCPADGNVNTEMLSTINGLDSVMVTLDSKSDSRLKGRLIGGEGSCPDSEGVNKYCTQRSDYAFDAPIIR